MRVYTLLENSESKRDGFITVFRGNFSSIAKAHFKANNLLLEKDLTQFANIYYTLLVTELDEPSKTEYNSTMRGTVIYNRPIKAHVIKWSAEGVINNGIK